MHPNPSFRTATREQNIAFARERGFGTLAVNGADGPLLSHVPFVVSQDEMTLEMHLVRSNPIARALATPLDAVISIQGPDSYISPDWYEINNQVPTWNYIAVHIRGRLEQLASEALRPHLDALSLANETKLLPKVPWTADKMDQEPLERMMRMIVPCRMTIETVDGTWKLGQNKPTEPRSSAAAQVTRNTLGHETAKLAALMNDVTTEP
ncbi:FMN-binding negative transcriptional regulator [Falsihalocynthiibacter sp. SS001]|uniref:FMN-binding negative transcriptional regulator n=1 Tax=Falsihalocynthiibacter sp. SS001 TaxID=3349698 RepID=UPI0036D393C5